MIGDILQPTHLLFVLIIALLVLGPKRLPDVAKSLGKGIRDFRGALSGVEDETRDFMGSATVSLPTTAQPTTPETTLTEPHVPTAAASSTAPALTEHGPAEPAHPEAG